MSEIKKKVLDAENFYQNQFVNFDYKLADYNFATLKKYFKGHLALELGPASGFMTKSLVKEFKELHIVEGSQILLDQIPNYENVIKHHSFFEEFNTDKKFDTIVMSHVLEHLSNPVEVLGKIQHWLADDGVFLLSVPNAKSIHRLVAVEMGLLKEVHELNQRDKDAGHYRVYDMDLLKSDVISAGLKVKESGGIFLKPLSNGQINELWSEEMIEGFYKVGKYFPESCAEVFVVCTK
jgi:2-polyprenyl-3-methyl-5-hydroxy-6-metoxy-1,4-benzoquinol methylase